MNEIVNSMDELSPKLGVNTPITLTATFLIHVNFSQDCVRITVIALICLQRSLV